MTEHLKIGHIYGQSFGDPESGKLGELTNVFHFTVMGFQRDDKGRPWYHVGLVPLRLCLDVVCTVAPNANEHHSQIQRHIDAKVEYVLKEYVLNALLVDNNDVFLHNHQTPVNTEQMNELLEKVNMVSCRDVVPPLSRLNFPFLVGKNESNLIADLQEYIQRSTESAVRSYVMQGFPNNIYPIETVEYKLYPMR